jgi:hypothetical protein
MQDFEAIWRRFYGDAEPVGWMMRHAGAKHWVRFHSLPLSKRYAETDTERQILLDRQNTLADKALGPNSRCWLVQALPEKFDSSLVFPAHAGSFTTWPTLSLESAFRFEVDEDDGEVFAWNTFVSSQIWEPGSSDDLLWAIANEDAACTLWMSCSDGAVFAPYDGGVDLFLPNIAKVQMLKDIHGDWLSNHPDGL